MRKPAKINRKTEKNGDNGIYFNLSVDIFGAFWYDRQALKIINRRI